MSPVFWTTDNDNNEMLSWSERSASGESLPCLWSVQQYKVKQYNTGMALSIPSFKSQITHHCCLCFLTQPIEQNLLSEYSKGVFPVMSAPQ